MNVHIKNGFLVIEGKAMVRVGAVLAVEIRHGGMGFSSPVINIHCNSYDEAEALHKQIEQALTATYRKSETEQ